MGVTMHGWKLLANSYPVFGAFGLIDRLVSHFCVLNNSNPEYRDTVVMLEWCCIPAFLNSMSSAD